MIDQVHLLKLKPEQQKELANQLTRISNSRIYLAELEWRFEKQPSTPLKIAISDMKHAIKTNEACFMRDIFRYTQEVGND